MAVSISVSLTATEQRQTLFEVVVLVRYWRCPRCETTSPAVTPGHVPVFNGGTSVTIVPGIHRESERDVCCYSGQVMPA